MATLLRGTGSTGVETHIRELVRISEHLGHQVSVITPFSRSVALSLPIFAVRRVVDPFSGGASVAWYRSWHYLFLRHALSIELARNPSSVIYASCPLSAMAALKARQGPHQRVVMAVHFDTSQADEWVDKGRIAREGMVFSRIRKIEKAILPGLDGIIFLSDSSRTALSHWLPEVQGVHSVVIPNFVHDVPSVTCPAGRKGDLVSVGALEWPKNQAFLLQVLADAKRQGYSYTLDIAGEGPCRKHLEQLRDSLGLQSQVRLLGLRDDVRSLLPAYRAYVHGSMREVMGMAPIEALAAGLPVFAVPVGGFPEIVTPGVEGLFWSASDPEGAARLLIGLLEDEPARQRMSIAARSRFERELAAEVVGPKIVDFVLGSMPTRDPVLA